MIENKKKGLLARLFRGQKENDYHGHLELAESGFDYEDAGKIDELIGKDINQGELETESLITPFPRNRRAGYLKFEEMAIDPTIDSALKMHVANALSAKTDTGEILFIASTKDGIDDKIVKDLRNTVGRWLNENAEAIAFQAAKYGLSFVRPYIEPNKGITHFRFDHYTHPAHIRCYERAGLLCGYTSKYQRSIEKKGVVELMEPWKFIPFKIPKWDAHNSTLIEPMRLNPLAFDINDDDYLNEEPIETQDYGSSLLRSAYDPWVDLNEAILALNSARKNAAKRDRFITIQTGKKNPALAAKYYNTILGALKRKRNLSAKRSAKRGHISTIDNHILPVTSDGSGQVNIQTEQTDVNISHIEDVNFHVNRLCSALGVDKSLVGFTEDMSGGLGEGGWWTQSMVAAIKSNLIRRAIKAGAERLCEIHVLMKWGKLYTEMDKPWRIEFNSLNNVLEREEATARESRINFATSVVTLMQMLDPELSKFDFQQTSNWLFTDVLRVNEETFKQLIEAAKEGDTDEVDKVLDSVSELESRNQLKTMIYSCIAELME
ncbi:portal protein (plasmid) [Xenorhabdus sp. SF857]|uniref:portal protein n=1 Tax=Xenorhabdus bakwenae TaxID=3026967 RepID=UPI002557F8AE|nr:portal protein [Xenorhabdus sp. SF857]WFQ78103.1 portal protein [Xenorhabdus sp. SF857]